MTISNNDVLAYEYYNSQIGENYFKNNLETDKQIEKLFDFCQILRANITDIGWKYFFETIGIVKMFEIDKTSGWFDTENQKEWIESIYLTSLICGYNPINGTIGKWDDNNNIFYSETSKTSVDWDYIHSIEL